MGYPHATNRSGTAAREIALLVFRFLAQGVLLPGPIASLAGQRSERPLEGPAARLRTTKPPGIPEGLVPPQIPPFAVLRLP